MTLMTEDIISTEIAGTLDGLMVERVRRTPDITAYRSFDADTKTWRDTSWKEVMWARKFRAGMQQWRPNSYCRVTG